MADQMSQNARRIWLFIGTGVVFGLGTGNVVFHSSSGLALWVYGLAYALALLTIVLNWRLRLRPDEYSQTLVQSGVYTGVLVVMGMAGLLMLLPTDGPVFTLGQGAFVGGALTFALGHSYAAWRMRR